MAGRPDFREWVDKQPNPGWTLLPLTHITTGVTAQDIIRDGKVEIKHCSLFNQALAYYFYGRPAYRLGEDGAIKFEAACPYCFIFLPKLIEDAKSIYAFDTGAFNKRLYKHALVDEMKVEDFSLETDAERPNKLISRVFPSIRAYLDGDLSQAIKPEDATKPGDFHARAYLALINSRGRNEPDDRICSIEVVFGQPVPLDGSLMAVVVPHTLWNETEQTSWLQALAQKEVRILPYPFIPGKHPEHYHTLMEQAVRDYYIEYKIL